MDKKAKIKKLTDYQAVLEDSKLKELIEGLPSGEDVWAVFQKSVETEIESLFAGTTQAETVQKVNDIEQLFDKLARGPLMQVLVSIDAKIGQQQPVAQQPAARPQQNNQQQQPLPRGSQFGAY